MADRPVTTLFMLVSVDGKISTGSTDIRDFDKDLQVINGVKEGLQQYYDLEQKTDLSSLNTGRVMAKVGWNEVKTNIDKIPVDFIIVDSKPHLSERGVRNLLERTHKLFLVTTNNQHPAFMIDSPDLEVVAYEKEIDFADLFIKLKAKGIDKMTVQSGGELNATLARQGLIDFVSIVVAPVLVGGKDTPTLIDGKSFTTDDELAMLKPLKLVSAETLTNSFLHLLYEVKNG